jgi:hypothetical protein
MNAQELAHWLRDEHQKVQVLRANLGDKVAIAPQTNQHRWIEEVRVAFEHLRAHCIKHMALEEQDGYMLAVVHRRPALTHEVDRLSHEHTELQRILERLHNELDQVRPDDHLLIHDCCARIRDVMGYLEHHESAENLLVFSAFTDDLGTTD